MKERGDWLLPMHEPDSLCLKEPVEEHQWRNMALLLSWPGTEDELLEYLMRLHKGGDAKSI